jgi:hypothetical protein
MAEQDGIKEKIVKRMVLTVWFDVIRLTFGFIAQLR